MDRHDTRGSSADRPGRLQTKRSVADSINEDLRAPRRRKSYEYLNLPNEDQRAEQPHRFDYHEVRGLQRSGRSFNYVDADQNRSSDSIGNRRPDAAAAWRYRSTGDMGPRRSSRPDAVGSSGGLRPAASRRSMRSTDDVEPIPRHQSGRKDVGESPLNSGDEHGAGADQDQGSPYSSPGTSRRVRGELAKQPSDHDDDGAAYQQPRSHRRSRDPSVDIYNSESDDEEWLTEQLMLYLPEILNPTSDILEDRPKMANPGPIGLLGFGMTAILMSLHNTGHWSLFTVVPAMAICFGGGAQFIAGLLEWCRGNTFGYCAFTSYGAFWTSLVCIWMLPNTSTSYGTDLIQPATNYFIGMYMILWTLFSFLLWCCTLRMNLAIFVFLMLVTLDFLLISIGLMAHSRDTIKAAGYIGIVCGGVAMYISFAEVLNEVWDRTILPTVPMTQVVALFYACSPSATGGAAEQPESDKRSSDASTQKSSASAGSVKKSQASEGSAKGSRQKSQASNASSKGSSKQKQ